VGRIVVVSIIGIDRATGGYSAAKVAHNPSPPEPSLRLSPIWPRSRSGPGRRTRRSPVRRRRTSPRRRPCSPPIGDTR
jgi:hypothetical protein